MKSSFSMKPGIGMNVEVRINVTVQSRTVGKITSQSYLLPLKDEMFCSVQDKL